MKIKINRNILWSQVLIEQFAAAGVKYACISPGSRNTPLTFAVSSNKKIKSFVFVDERASAFFAVGLAKRTGTPVIIITTSGTAAAELYPAIVEAYKSRVPLIICTADRPPYLRDKGANQTINQKDIYKNHIRYSAELNMPVVASAAFTQLKIIAVDAYNTACCSDKGPVHINIPFEKPFEPDSYTDVAESNLLVKLKTVTLHTKKLNVCKESINKKFVEKIKRCKKGIIFCGYADYSSRFISALIEISVRSGFPILADAASGLRFGTHNKDCFIDNYNTLFNSESFKNKYNPEIIIQFGAAPTSAAMLEYFNSSAAEKYLVNEYGEWNDPSGSAKELFRIRPEVFCRLLNIKLSTMHRDRSYFNALGKADKIISQHKKQFIKAQAFKSESSLPGMLLNLLPKHCSLFVSNSLPVRDFDNYAPSINKNVKLYASRGASGIDGIISTAMGIEAASNEPAFLITGDLAFFYDMNSLFTPAARNSNLVIILVNNNGGGIFEHLPVSKYRDKFEEYFKTPLNLDCKKIAEAAGYSYINAKNAEQLKSFLKTKHKGIKIAEIKTDVQKSLLIRKKYKEEALRLIDNFCNNKS